MENNEKICLLEDNNDLLQKQAQEYLKKRFVKSALDTYRGVKVEEKELKKFMIFLNRFVKPNKSKNGINYRIKSLYAYIISKYSDFMEINDIVLNEID